MSSPTVSDPADSRRGRYASIPPASAKPPRSQPSEMVATRTAPTDGRL
uniref:Indole-3-acetate beta-glucosyltransferase n=1 Tax=Arundo donax TaxID=35708 RepID=A0A0A9HD38_ARUDO